MKRSIAVLILLILLTSSSYGLELSLKFSGGPRSLDLDNINRALNDWAAWLKKKASYDKNWNYEKGQVEKFHSGFDFGGEIMLALTPNISVSIGSGYLYGEITDKETELTIQKKKSTEVQTSPKKVSAYPINLTGYFFLPIKEKFKIYFKGETGWLWGKYVNREGKTRLPSTQFKYSSQIANGKGLSIGGGLGFSVEVDSYLMIFIEGEARRASVSGFKGELKGGGSGTLYFFEEYDSNLDYWQAKFQILAEEPKGEEFRSVGKAKIDLSGFSLKIGIIIKL